ncbi:MAG TPA: hypothetical protein VNW52_11210 [Burkholderiaceae bacterium]|nr:hypothetical protein [Burkholderiaceae bacterium]
MLLAGCGSTISESVGGTLSGLSGATTVVLTNNGTDALTLKANGTFTFPTAIDAGSAYNVAVQSYPTGETCTVTNATGTVSSTAGAVTNVTVYCSAITTNYNSVSGTVTGLPPGTTVTLQDNGTDSLIVKTNGTFAFPTQLLIGSSYVITVATPPAGGSCTLTNGSGAVPAAGGSTPIVVTCT